jgi:hypothetical protein
MLTKKRFFSTITVGVLASINFAAQASTQTKDKSFDPIIYAAKKLHLDPGFMNYVRNIGKCNHTYSLDGNTAIRYSRCNDQKDIGQLTVITEKPTTVLLSESGCSEGYDNLNIHYYFYNTRNMNLNGTIIKQLYKEYRKSNRYKSIVSTIDELVQDISPSTKKPLTLLAFTKDTNKSAYYYSDTDTLTTKINFSKTEGECFTKGTEEACNKCNAKFKEAVLRAMREHKEGK